MIIYSHLTYINGIHGNDIGLTKKLSISIAMPKNKSKQNLIFNKYMLTIWKIDNSKKGQ